MTREEELAALEEISTATATAGSTTARDEIRAMSESLSTRVHKDKEEFKKCRRDRLFCSLFCE